VDGPSSDIFIIINSYEFLLIILIF
jgi:hypothetical protein